MDLGDSQQLTTVETTIKDERTTNSRREEKDKWQQWRGPCLCVDLGDWLCNRGRPEAATNGACVAWAPRREPRHSFISPARTVQPATDDAWPLATAVLGSVLPAVSRQIAVQSG